MGFGFDFMFTLVPIFIGVIFVIMLVSIISGLSRNAKRERKNDQSPRVTANVKVVSKRMEVGGNRSNRRMGANGMMENGYSYSYSDYFVTFEFESGDRLELPVDGSDYGLLVEGDTGRLSFQGTRYLGFERGTAQAE
mgnify:CR=1 FL=1